MPRIHDDSVVVFPCPPKGTPNPAAEPLDDAVRDAYAAGRRDAVQKLKPWLKHAVPRFGCWGCESCNCGLDDALAELEARDQHGPRTADAEAMKMLERIIATLPLPIREPNGCLTLAYAGPFREALEQGREVVRRVRAKEPKG